MKKKKFLRISCIAIIACLMFSVFPTSAFAADLNNQQISTSQKSSYFDEKTVLAYGQSFIKDTISFDHTTSWTKNTQPSEIIKTYDTDNNVNAYIINLKTNGKLTGYMLIEAFTSGEPNIMEYGYSGVYYLTDKRFENLKNKKIVYTGNRDFYVESSGQYYRAEDNTKTDSAKSTMKNECLAKTNKTLAQRNRLNSLGTVYQSVTVPNLWNSKFIPYTMDEFKACLPYTITNHCEVTMGMNMLKYWAICRGVVPLFINYSAGTSFTCLKDCMNYNNGVSEPDGFKGILYYLMINHLKAPLGSDFRDNSHLDWATMKAEIDHGIPFEMGGQVGSEWHSYLVTGYENRSDGTYVRVINEWNTNKDNFYRYLYSNVSEIWYYRWA